MKAFQSKIGYNFKNENLLKEALTHSSYMGNQCKISNERLEFLGDSVLSVVVSKYLFENLTDIPEGNLTKLRASIVCEDSLYIFAKEIGLGEKIFLGKGEEHSGGRTRKSILADAFEAVIAALYLDGGMEAAAEFILPFIPSLEFLRAGKTVNSDYKTFLQEIIQQNPEEKVTYQLIEESGAAHSRIFTMSVLLNDQIIGTGMGKSKKEAEQMAAKEALSLMGYND